VSACAPLSRNFATREPSRAPGIDGPFVRLLRDPDAGSTDPSEGGSKLDDGGGGNDGSSSDGSTTLDASSAAPPGWSSLLPIARGGQSMAWDGKYQRIALFGGSNIQNEVMGDTWSWDGARWRESYVTGPSKRRGAPMIYDEDKKVLVLFGGQSTTAYFSDTWQLDGATWTEKKPAGSVPAPRGDAAIAYDSVR
jgi:hypothetical protein